MGSISQGEQFPLAVKVLPVDESYSNFVINEEDTYVEILNDIGKSIDVYGTMSVDATNQTVLFSWDTSKYEIGSYTIAFWISITYNDITFLMKSTVLSKSIKKSSLLR